MGVLVGLSGGLHPNGYNCRNDWGSLMQKLSWMLLLLLASLVHAEDEKAMVVGSAEELKGITAQKIIWKKDGSEMVLIPGGAFEMGDHFNEGDSNELPVHTVALDAFYMDKTEVTVGQFKTFLDDSDYNWTGSRASVDKYSPTDDHPMIYVTWDDAVAYAEWVGKRLPTEAEWEYAARGGLQGQRYPWGGEVDNTKANYGNNAGTTTVTDSYPANGYGLYDVAGNVWEWCADWYGSDYYSNSPAKNPLGPDTGSKRVLRGGNWYSNTGSLRVAYRNGNYPNNRYYYYGFRCVSGSDYL